MKKKLIALLFATFGALAFGQTSWKHSAGLSLSTAFYSMNAKGDGVKNAFVPRISARYYGEMDNGFCLSGTFDIGWSLSKNFSLESENNLVSGLALGTTFGLGYAFHFSDRWSLSILGSLSLDWMTFKFKKKIYANVSGGTVSSDWTQKDSLVAFGLGCEAIGFFPLSNHISLYGVLSLRFFDAGKLKRSGSNMGVKYDDSFEIRGNVSITPAFGAIWTF